MRRKILYCVCVCLGGRETGNLERPGAGGACFRAGKPESLLHNPQHAGVSPLSLNGGKRKAAARLLKADEGEDDEGDYTDLAQQL